jgi:hypothetical protein
LILLHTVLLVCRVGSLAKRAVLDNCCSESILPSNWWNFRPKIWPCRHGVCPKRFLRWVSHFYSTAWSAYHSDLYCPSLPLANGHHYISLQNFPFANELLDSDDEWRLWNSCVVDS